MLSCDWSIVSPWVASSDHLDSVRYSCIQHPPPPVCTPWGQYQELEDDFWQTSGPTDYDWSVNLVILSSDWPAMQDTDLWLVDGTWGVRKLSPRMERGVSALNGLCWLTIRPLCLLGALAQGSWASFISALLLSTSACLRLPILSLVS